MSYIKHFRPKTTTFHVRADDALPDDLRDGDSALVEVDAPVDGADTIVLRQPDAAQLQLLAAAAHDERLDVDAALDVLIGLVEIRAGDGDRLDDKAVREFLRYHIVALNELFAKAVEMATAAATFRPKRGRGASKRR